MPLPSHLPRLQFGVPVDQRFEMDDPRLVTGEAGAFRPQLGKLAHLPAGEKDGAPHRQERPEPEMEPQAGRHRCHSIFWTSLP